MLIDTEYLKRGRKLIVSYVDKTGNIKLKYYTWDNPTRFVSCDDDDPHKHPTYKSWDDKAVKQISVDYPDRYAIYEFLDALPEEEQKEIFDLHFPKIFFVDIETEIVDGFPEAADVYDKNGVLIKEGAATMIQSISVVYDNKIILMGVKEMSEETQKRIIDKTNKYFEDFGVKYKFKYLKYNDEFDMLYTFFYKMVPKMPLITGWNFLEYDWQYLVNRSRKLTKEINGKTYRINPNVSSPTKKLKKKWGAEYELPSHRMIFDYMQLYNLADTSIKVKESSSLDFVSEKLLKVNKIKYTGSLQTLYEEDFETFMYYNAVDSVLVQKIHDVGRYIEIIFAISSLSRIRISDVINPMSSTLASLAITEGVLRGRFRDMRNIVLFKDEEKDVQSTIKGGWVKDPVVGLNQWVVCYDFASLYPTTQRQFYISPENFLGIQSKEDKNKCSNGKDINKDEHVVCVNGAVFRKTISPTLNMLEEVYGDRKVNKKIMMGKKEELDEILEEIKELEGEI